jgi:hypothetical protein
LEQTIPEKYRSRTNSKEYPYSKGDLKSEPYSCGHLYTFKYMEKGWQDWEKKFEIVFPS